MIMLDTNICVYILRDRPAALLECLKKETDISISSVVYAELLYGIELSPKKLREARNAQLERFLRLLSVMPWTEEAARHYSQVRAFLKKEGTPIGNMDLLIGAHAKSLDVLLVTNNVKEFERIPQLKTTNWI